MAIRFTKFIDITSAVGGVSQVSVRIWCARVFTTNVLIGPTSILQFATANDVGLFFGFQSEEYTRAVNYFAYVSPLGVQPTAIQFARFVAAAQPATIFGATSVPALATLQAISAGLLSLQFGSTVVALTGINLSTATTLAGVATLIQTALRANAAAELSSATVTWNTSAQAFDFVASTANVTTEALAVVQPAGVVTNTDVAAALGWYSSQGAVVNSAQIAESRLAGFNRVMSVNNNCGSFCYTRASTLTLADAAAIATANAALNVMFIFRVYVSPEVYATWSAALIGLAGVGLEFESDSLLQYIEMLPMSIQAAIDFDAVDGTVGFMYKQNSLYSPSVTDDGVSDTLDAARVNYYGQTQKGGQVINFYQRGVLCGGSTAPVDSTIFANEQWFKDLQGTNLINLQLSAGRIPANARGQAMCELVLQSGIDAAVRNGTISVDSTLTIIQQAFITSQTGDRTAWQQLQVIGYWMATNITEAVNTSGVTEYTLNYVILYRKDDVIKTIIGSHQLI